MVAPENPVAGPLDFAELAGRFKMAGGPIRNAMLRPAFSAADGADALTQAHLLGAARREYQAMHRLPTC